MNRFLLILIILMHKLYKTYYDVSLIKKTLKKIKLVNKKFDSILTLYISWKSITGCMISYSPSRMATAWTGTHLNVIALMPESWIVILLKNSGWWFWPLFNSSQMSGGNIFENSGALVLTNGQRTVRSGFRLAAELVYYPLFEKPFDGLMKL